jgi:hypothetical protein
MRALFRRGSVGLDGFGVRFSRAACGRRRSLLEARLVAGRAKAGHWSHQTRETARRACGGAPGARQPTLGRVRCQGRAAAPRYRGACRGVPARLVADAAASSRLWGPFRQDFGGYGRQNPTEPASFFGNFLSVCDLRARLSAAPHRKCLPGGHPSRRGRLRARGPQPFQASTGL